MDKDLDAAVMASGSDAIGRPLQESGLVDFHGRIEQRFRQLAQDRGSRPVYGLEHGIPSGELPQLRRVVGDEVRQRGIGTNFNSGYLALVAVASEVGYEYRGTGTDFWPIFESVLSASISTDERSWITHFFETAHRVYGLRKPVDSAWNRLFRHIAWPIANAVAPKEIHRPLAGALRDTFRVAGGAPDEDRLVFRLRSAAARVGSPRLSNWLNDGDLAAAVAWHLLDQQDPLSRISEETLRRVFADLATDTVARKAVARASALHQRQSRSSAQKLAISGRARLVMQDDPELGPALYLQLPYLAASERVDLRTGLARSGVRPRLWGMSDPVDPDQLLSAQPIGLASVYLDACIGSGVPFLSLPPQVPEEIAGRLRSLAPKLDLPIVLLQDERAGSFAQIPARSLPPGIVRLLVASALPAPASVLALGEICGLRCFEIRERSTEVMAWTSSLGLASETEFRVDFGLAVPIGQNLLGPVFLEGQTIMLRISGVPKNQRVTVGAPGLGSLEVHPDAIVAVEDAIPGEHVLDLEAAGRHVRVGFTVVPPEPISPLLVAALEPSHPTADDLISGDLVLHVRSTLPISETSVAVSVRSHGQEIARSREEGVRLPAVITSSSPLIASLAESLSNSGAARSRNLELSVTIGEGWTQRWRLDWQPRRCEWEFIDGEWHALAESEELPIISATGSNPLVNIEAVAGGPDQDLPRLLTPVLHGHPLLSEALCISPPAMMLGGFNVSLPVRLLREPETREAGTGLLATLSSWLGWSSAQPLHVVAEAARRRVADELERLAVRQLCGDQWADVERNASPRSSSQWSALVEVAVEGGLASGGMLPDVEARDLPRLKILLENCLESAEPLLWEIDAIESPEELAAKLDMAVISAYEMLAEKLASEGRPIDDPDANNAAEKWLAAIAQAREQHSASPLSAMILPKARARALVQADYRHLDFKDVVELLCTVHLDLNLRPPNWLRAEAIETALALWIEPRSVANDPDWPQHATRLLADRQTARAARYAALRYRAARGAGTRS